MRPRNSTPSMWFAVNHMKVKILDCDVTAFVGLHDQPDVTKRVLNGLRVHSMLSAVDLLSLIGYGLDSPAELTRRRAVEAAADLPLVERSAFLAQFNRPATYAQEISEIRAAAARAIKK